ncbi:phage tail protein [Actinobacillus delphinicola]|nr:GpE family phage tail protein [Actinobacillus delphinicola]MDG6896575.1 phage tail protein [Actinobacillus delphinicola]
MADLAIVFHWTFADCADMNLAELMNWREKARQRSETENA